MALIKLNNQSLTAVSALPAAIATGNVLQVQSTVGMTSFSTSSTTYVKCTNLQVNITPISTSSKILVMVNAIAFPGTYTRYLYQTIFKTIGGTDTDISGTTSATGNDRSGLTYFYDTGTSVTRQNVSLQFVDSPSTTSQITYSPAVRVGSDSHTITFGQSNLGNTIIAMEIAG
jgi:hypothetical protein